MAVADFTNPKLTQDYTTLLQSIRDLNNSQALLHDSTGVVNVLAGTIRWYGTNNRFEKFDGSVWNPLSTNYSFGAATFTGSVIIGAASEGDLYLGSSGGVFYGNAGNAGWYKPGLGSAISWSTSTGIVNTLAGLNCGGGITATTANFSGDLRVWRSGASTTGVVYFGQSSAGTYLYYDGNNFQFNGGAVSINGGTGNFLAGLGTFTGTTGTVLATNTNGSLAGFSMSDPSGSGPNIRMTNGSGQKYLRITGNTFNIVNAAYSAQLWTVDDAGNMYCSGNVGAFSDERVKTNWQALPVDFLKRLAEVKYGIYDRTDISKTQVGVSAQSLQKLLPDAVETTKNPFSDRDELSVVYGNAAMVSAIELAKEIISLKEYNKTLEARLIALENK